MPKFIIALWILLMAIAVVATPYLIVLEVAERSGGHVLPIAIGMFAQCSLAVLWKRTGLDTKAVTL